MSAGGERLDGTTETQRGNLYVMKSYVCVPFFDITLSNIFQVV